MRIKVIGDHSDYHCGSAAVFRALCALLGPHEIVTEGADFDILVVNGEGSMHHDTPHCRQKLEHIAAAQAMGRRTFLINTVWQGNSATHDDILRRATILTRGPASSADLALHHGITAAHHLDLAWFAARAPAAPLVDFAGQTITTDFWSPEWGGFVRPSSGPLATLPFFDLGAGTWDQAIATIGTAGLLVTGRHHAMYAACRARVPFVPVVANTHKMEDLLDAAPVRIPVCRTLPEIRAFMRNASAQADTYAKLFDWMEQQAPPDLRAMIAGNYRPTKASRPAQSELRKAFQAGKAAYIAGRMAEASDHLGRARRVGARFDPRTLIVASSRSGRGWIAAEAFVEAVLGETDRLDLMSAIGELGKDEAGWTDLTPAGDAPAWWRLACAAGQAAGVGGVDESRVLAEAAQEAAGAVPREAVRTALLARAFQLWRVGLADHLHMGMQRDILPGWFVRYNDLYYAARRRIYSPTALAAARAALRDPQGVDERLLSLMLEQVWLGQGADADLLRDASILLAAHPQFRSTFPLRVATLAVALGQPDFARKVILQHAVPTGSIRTSLALACTLDVANTVPLRRLWQDRAAAEARLCDLLADDRLSLAIVGNGPLSHPDHARLIDTHDVVIRFNDFVLNDDTGHRVDFNLTVLHNEPAFRQPHLSQARHGSVLMQPLMPYLSLSWTQVEILAGMNHPIAFLPDVARLDLQRSLGHPPSSGLQAAGLVAALRSGARNARVFGMPLLQGGVGREREPGGRVHERHDWDGEQRIFATLGFPDDPRS